MTPHKIPPDAAVIDLDGVLISVDLIKSILGLDGVRKHVGVAEDGTVSVWETRRDEDLVEARGLYLSRDGILAFLDLPPEGSRPQRAEQEGTR